VDFWFYGYGKKQAPRDWHFKNLPYTNRLYVVLGGTAFFVGPQGERPLLKDHLYLFPHRLPFQARQNSEDRINHLFFDFVITPPLLGDELIEIPLEENTLLWHNIRCLLMTVGQENTASLVRGYFENLMQLLLWLHPELHLRDARMSEVFGYMHEHFGEPLTDGLLAQLVHMETNHFIRVFRQATGITPYQYLREYRLNRAAALIRDGASVQEAALRCGYESTASLSHAMRKSRGISPAACRG